MTTPTQGEHAQKSAPAGVTPACLTCNDHGAVGNILTAEPCPDCTPAQPAAPQGVAYAELPKASANHAVKTLQILQSHLGPSRTRCDEDERMLWDRIDRDIAALRASHGQAPAQPVALPSDRELQEIAMQAAWRHSREPDAPKYLPRSPVHAATWKPHAWVVAAMKDAIEAATQPKKDHHDELS